MDLPNIKAEDLEPTVTKVDIPYGYEAIIEGNAVLFRKKMTDFEKRIDEIVDEDVRNNTPGGIASIAKELMRLAKKQIQEEFKDGTSLFISRKDLERSLQNEYENGLASIPRWKTNIEGGSKAASEQEYLIRNMDCFGRIYYYISTDCKFGQQVLLISDLEKLPKE